jgi:hypothetical protein
MVRVAFGIVCFVLIASCREPVGALPKPVGLIPEDKLVNILTDLSLIEAHVQMNYLQVARYKKVMERSGDQIVKRHGVSRDQFESSMDYYGSRQERMQKIYSRVLDSLNLLSGRIVPPKDSEPKAPTISQDSLRKMPGLMRMTLGKKQE